MANQSTDPTGSNLDRRRGVDRRAPHPAVGAGVSAPAALRPGSAPLRTKLAATLAETSVADARDAYAAIRLAAPGGLGRAPEQDVTRTPTVPLSAAMALAAERDAIAREYVTEFRATFEVGVAALRRALGSGLGWPEATVEAYLALLAAAPDTHIARKLGAAEAAAVQRRAQDVLAAGGVRTSAGRDAITVLDRELRHERNRRNPGATADLTGAAIFVVLLEGGWRRGGGEEGDTVTVAMGGKPRYVFPKGDCALLPIPNTTVEMLAQYLAGRVARALASSEAVDLQAIEVEVEENFGQSATYRESLE